MKFEYLSLIDSKLSIFKTNSDSGRDTVKKITILDLEGYQNVYLYSSRNLWIFRMMQDSSKIINKLLQQISIFFGKNLNLLCLNNLWCNNWWCNWICLIGSICRWNNLLLPWLCSTCKNSILHTNHAAMSFIHFLDHLLSCFLIKTWNFNSPLVSPVFFENWFCIFLFFWCMITKNSWHLWLHH